MSRRPPNHDELPVTIITGFLGSGKTTLLNHILSNQQGIRTAVLVNEFGEIGIDQELIVSDEDGIVELTNGCICCSINNQLVETVARLLQQRHRFDYLIVETTGLADPMPVAMTFVGRDLSPHTRLDSIITLVDAENYSVDQFKGEVAYNQIKYGDIILLNKADCVDGAALDRLEGKIREVKPDARIIRSVQADVPLSLIIGVDLYPSEHALQPLKSGLNANEALCPKQRPVDTVHSGIEGFTAISFENNRGFVAERLQTFLSEQLPTSAYRAKGILYIDGHDERFLFHLCGRRFTMEQSEWGQQPRRNRLVIIGRNLDHQRIHEQLSDCLVPVSMERYRVPSGTKSPRTDDREPSAGKIAHFSSR